MIRTSFIDFDDTLAVHNWTEEPLTHNSVDDYAQLWVGGRYNKFIVPLNMQLICIMLKRFNVDMYTLTHEESSLALQYKQDFVEEHYRNMFKGVVTSSTSIGKVDIMLGYCKAFNIPKAEVLIIDDKIDTILSAKEAGFVTMTPQEIMCSQMHEIQKRLGFPTDNEEVGNLCEI